MPPKSMTSSASKPSKQSSITAFFKSASPATPRTSSTPEGESNSAGEDNDIKVTFVSKSSSNILSTPTSKAPQQRPCSLAESSPSSNGTAAPSNNKGHPSSRIQNGHKKLGKTRPRKALDSSPEEPIYDSDKDPEFTMKSSESDSESDMQSEGDSEVEDEEQSESEIQDVDSYSTPQKRKRGDANGGTGKANKRRAFTAPTRSTPASNLKNRKASASKTAGPKNTKGHGFATESNGDTIEEVADEDGELGGEDSNDALEPIRHTHESLEFLDPDKIRDKSGTLHKVILARGKDIGGEEKPKTLKLPPGYLDSCTPALKQWWEIKCDNFDCVLFFKLGKFYEMYHMDADVGVKELGLIFMKGAHAHCGFPEGAFSNYANRLVQKGYKVMRVEQTMTAQQVKERKLKTMPRENIRIYTPGTRSVSTLESEIQMKENVRESLAASCLLVLLEKVHHSAEGNEDFEYGVCVLYPGPGTFWVGQFKEDRYHSRLRTLLAHHAPNEVILERSRTSPQLNQVLRSSVLTANKEYLASNEFVEVKKALTLLMESEYFGPILKPEWPTVLAEMLDFGGSLPDCKSDSELAIRAVGTCALYLRRCRIDFELISLKNFYQYNPNVQITTQVQQQDLPKYMVLDGVTLINLDVIPSSSNTGGKTLLHDVNRCKTKFGKRLLLDWLAAPLYRVSDIVDRQQAVQELGAFKRDHDKEYDQTVQLLKSLPDFERLLSKIHVVGSLKRNKDHPESRAVMFDDKVYSKKKIMDFVATVDAFKRVSKMIRDFGQYFRSTKSSILRSIFFTVEERNGGIFPDLQPILDHFMHAFNAKEAQEAGTIIPKVGVDEVYDSANQNVKEIQQELEEYRNKISRDLHCPVSYFHQARNRYQLELPDSACKNMPQKFTKKSQKKGFQRYWTKDIESMLERLITAEEALSLAVKDSTRRVFEKFDNHYAEWSKAVKCITTLDVLISLEEYSCNLFPTCVPVFVEPSPQQRPFLAIKDGRHPLIVTTFFGGEFIPNDSFIGIADAEEPSRNGEVVLVTGPNMGGKSTLMRQIGLICILAQLGANVPAVSCEMTPVDRIFTRIGASDNLLAGESTFLVELSETSSVLQHATRNSLVLMDELGRGTATFDGTAIAAAVLQDLASRIKCRTVFSTHYHSLVERFQNHPEIKLGHLGCQVENENDEDPTKETITLLYKFVHGDCPKSYGFNAAKLAGISNQIVKRAHERAKIMEQRMQFGQQQR